MKKMKEVYLKPTMQIVWLKTQGILMTASYVEKTGEAESMENGSFGSRGSISIWDDEEEEQY